MNDEPMEISVERDAKKLMHTFKANGINPPDAIAAMLFLCVNQTENELQLQLIHKVIDDYWGLKRIGGWPSPE